MATILIVLVALSLAGIGFVFWLLKSDSESEEEIPKLNITEPEEPSDLESSEEDEPPSPEKLNLQPDLMVKLASIKEDAGKPKDSNSESKEPSSILGGALKKLNLDKSDADEEVPMPTPFQDLKEYYGEKTKEKPDAENNQNEPPEKKSDISNEIIEEHPLSVQEEKGIEKEIELTSDLKELKEKYDKLDSMFNEKSAEHEKLKESLNNELKNRKEFNKVKDILEKELKDSKDQARSIQSELSKTQSESESQKKRTEQLDEKNVKLEKDILEKEDKINELEQKTQNPAEPSGNPTPSEDTKEEKAEEHSPSPEKEDEQSTQKEEGQFLKLKPDVFSDEPKDEPLKEESDPSLEKEDKPENTGGFKLDLTIDDDQPKPETESNNEPPKDSPET